MGTESVSTRWDERIPNDERNSVLAFFCLFFTTVIIDTFVGATNWYGNSAGYKGWQDVIASELKAFLACVLRLGQVSYLSRELAKIY
jgi:hypothetical protein